MGRLFGTDGVRGVINIDLTPELAMKIGLAAGTFFGEDSRILIGRDVRRGGKMFQKAVVAGLLSAGVKVYDAGLLPTPTLQFAVKHFGFDGGIIITASHNPPKYNGIKVIAADGVEISREDEAKIEEIIFSEKWFRAPYLSLAEEIPKFHGIIDAYVKSILQHVDVEKIKSKKFRVLIDPANSVGVLTSPLVAKKLGCKVYTLNGNLDGDFPGREPEPTTETLKETAEVAKALHVDLAVGHDGDADRAIFIDEKGRIHWGDRSAAILCKYLAKKGHRGKVVTAVSSSTIIEEVLKPYGLEVVWTKVGSVGISRIILKESNALCGFEENGGFMYPPHIPVRDGSMTLALMLQVMADENKKLSELFDELPHYYVLKTKIPMTRTAALKVVEKVAEHFRNYRLITIDGVKVLMKDSWVLVRPSGTEPILRIMAEAKDENKLKEIVGIVKNLAEEVLKSK
ncbi:MAG: phosphoglucosamine mutase [Thermoprotei archaeon]|nr:MAG: phosphoglucosamine mutase [Thermoprotei archaeon]